MLHLVQSFHPIYMLSLGHIIQKHNLSFYRYADDTQVYLSLKPYNYSRLTDLNSCLLDIKIKRL